MLTNPLINHAFRFGIVGIIATLAHYLTALLVSIWSEVIVANMIGYLIAIVISYTGHYYFTFNTTTTGSSHAYHLTNFLITSVSALLLSQAILSLFTTFFSASNWVSLAIAVLIIPPYTFTLNYLWVFKRHPNNTEPSKKTSSHNLFSIASLIIMAIVIFSFLLWWIGATQQDLHIYNSDVLHPFLLISDIFKDLNSLSTWYHSPAPYVFPDWLLTSLTIFSGASGGWQPLLYAGLIFFLYCIAAGYTLKSTVPTNMVPGSCFFAFLVILLGVGIYFSNTPDVSAFLYASLAAPYIHTGALLISFMALGLFLRAIYDTNTIKIRILLYFTVFLATFSDLIFVVWFILPAIITAAIHYAAERNKHVLKIAAAIAISASFGALVANIIHNTQSNYLSSSSNTPAGSIKWLVTHINLAKESFDIPLLLLILFIFALFIRATILVNVALHSRKLERHYSFEVLLAGMAAGTLSAPIMTGLLGQFGSLRYFLLLLMIPLLWLSHVALRSVSEKCIAWVTPVFLATSSVFCVTVVDFSWSTAERLASPRSIQSCLQDKGHTAGFSDYWNAKLLILLSDGQLHIAQISSEGTPHRWNTNERWFTRRTDNDQAPNFDFILPQNLDKETLRTTFGSPEEVIICGNQEAWLYSDTLKLR